MAGRSVDVSLVIKAIDQSKSALDTVAKGLSSINVAQRSVAAGSGDVGKALDDLLKNLDGLSNASKILDTGLRNSVQSYSQQTAALQAANAAIDERKRKIADLERTEARLAALQGTYKTRLGKDVAGPRIPALSGVQSSLETERGKLDRDQQSIDRIIGNIATAQQGIRETKSAQLEVATAIKTVTQQYDELTAAAKRAGEAQKEALAKAAAEAQRTELGQLADRERLGAAIGRNTGTTRIPATQAGATFSALAAREETTAASAAEEVKKLEAAQKAAAEAAKEAEVAAKREAEALASLKLYARDVAEALDPAAKTSRLLAEEQDKLAAAVKAGALSQAQADAAFSKYRDELTGVAAAQRAEVRETERLAASMQELKRQIDPAAAAEEYLTQKTLELNKALKAGILTQEQYAKALAHVKAQSESMKDNKSLTLFGLRPYETQNLMFQINDVVTQLASGTSVTQTLAQQGGQILQLFPRVGNAIAGAITPMAALGVAAVAAFGLVVKHAIDAETQIRELTAALAANADGGRYNAKGVIEAAKAMREFGVATEDAMKVAKIAIKEGLDQSQLTVFGEAAKGLSIALGTDVPAAAQKLNDSLTGGYAALVALDDQTNLLTASERERIRLLYEQGDATKAQALQTQILYERLRKLSQDSEGPWEKAVNKLASSWNRFIDALSSSAMIQGVVNALQMVVDVFSRIIEGVNTATNAINRFTGFGPTNSTTGSAGTRTGTGTGTGTDNGIGNAGTPSEIAQKRVDDLKITLDQIRAEKGVTTELEKQNRLKEDLKRLRLEDSKDGAPKSREEAALRETIIQAKLSRLAEKYNDQLKQIADARKRVAEQAKREAEQREKEQNTYQYQAAAMLRDIEKFRGKAYPDYTYRNGVKVNSGYRVGYGSDTVTRRDGTYYRVSPNTTTTKADAERDLARRIEEFANVVKQNIGAGRFNQFSAAQQASLISIAYNYGTLDRVKGKGAGISGVVKEGTVEQIAAAIRKLATDNNGINANRRLREAGAFDKPNLAVEQGAQTILDQRAQLVKDYNAELDDRLSKEERSIKNQQELVGLQGEELVAAKERQAVQEALLQAQQELRDKTGNPNANLSADQVFRIAKNAASQFDNQYKPAVRETLQKSVDDLLALRDTIQQQIRSETERGNTSVVTELEAQLDTVNGKLVTAVEKLREFLTTPGNAAALGISSEELDNILLKLDAATAKTRDWAFEFGGVKLSVDDIANAFANNAVSAIDQFAQAVANGQNAFGALWDAFRQFAADFLIQMAQMIQRQIIFNLVSGLLKGLTGGLGRLTEDVTKTINANPGIFHSGGIAGQATQFTTVHPAVFANAMRYHTGGIAGLKPGEVPAVLMQGEEVLTRKDPRHILNGGGGGRGDVKIVNAFDEGDVISKAMNTKAGEKAILNLVRSNPRAFKAALSGG